MVDKVRGFASAFTVRLEERDFLYMNCGHEKFSKKGYNFMKILSPGLFIRYFNGMEEKVYLSDFGEEFEELLSYKQSANGKYVSLMGKRKGPLNDY